MLDVIDAVLELIEPGGAMDPATALRQATSGTTVVHTGSRPYEVEFDADRLYAWPGIDRHVTMEAGDPPATQERFTLEVAYLVASQGEQARSRPVRAVSEALDAKAHAYLEALTANVALAGAWEDIGGEINPDSIRGFEVRGIGLRLSGWRYLQGA